MRLGAAHETWSQIGYARAVFLVGAMSNAIGDVIHAPLSVTSKIKAALDMHGQIYKLLTFPTVQDVMFP